MWKRAICATVFLAVCSYCVVYSQSNLVIIDKETGITLPNAHVCFESLDKEDTSYALTNGNGIVENKVLKRSLISVSFVAIQWFSYFPYRQR